MYCSRCNKNRKSKKPKISYIFNKTLFFSITCRKCGGNDEKLLKDEESIEILKSLGLINNTEK